MNIFCLINILYFATIASSSNGRTADSDSVNLGSSPGEAAKKPPRVGAFFDVSSMGSNQFGIASQVSRQRRDNEVVRSLSRMLNKSR